MNIEEIFQDSANELRGKLGTTSTIKATDIPDKISSIDIGIHPIGIKDITTNGTYDVTCFESANVNVSTDVQKNGYSVKTIAEMNALTGMVEGARCSVLESTEQRVEAVEGSSFQKYTIKDTITMSNAVSSNYSARWMNRDIQSTLTISLRSTFLRILFMGKSDYNEFYYTSSDGTTYTLNLGAAGEYDAGGMLTYETGSLPEGVLYIGAINFGGLYTYDGTSWNLSKIGSETTADKVLSGNNVYTDSGIITGTYDYMSVLKNNIYIQKEQPEATSGIWCKIENECYKDSINISELDIDFTDGDVSANKIELEKTLQFTKSFLDTNVGGFYDSQYCMRFSPRYSNETDYFNTIGLVDKINNMILIIPTNNTSSTEINQYIHLYSLTTGEYKKISIPSDMVKQYYSPAGFACLYPKENCSYFRTAGKSTWSQQFIKIDYENLTITADSFSPQLKETYDCSCVISSYNNCMYIRGTTASGTSCVFKYKPGESLEILASGSMSDSFSNAFNVLSIYGYIETSAGVFIDYTKNVTLDLNNLSGVKPESYTKLSGVYIGEQDGVALGIGCAGGYSGISLSCVKTGTNKHCGYEVLNFSDMIILNSDDDSIISTHALPYVNNNKLNFVGGGKLFSISLDNFKIINYKKGNLVLQVKGNKYNLSKEDAATLGLSNECDVIEIQTGINNSSYINICNAYLCIPNNTTNKCTKHNIIQALYKLTEDGPVLIKENYTE